MAPGLLITGATEVATLAGGPRRGSGQGDAGIVRRAGDGGGAGLAVAIVGTQVHSVGAEAAVRARLEVDGVDATALEHLDAAGCVVTPGLIDPHTHLLFAGTRERELRMRQEGAGYLDILAAGGGILSTVERTRAASMEQLHDHGRRWLDEMLRHGVTTIEAKSGYGLDVATELRLLEVAGGLDREGPVEVVPTYLGAHAVPPELRGRPDATDAYVRDVVERQLPQVREQGIARFCDVFCELGVFDASQSRRVLEAGADAGLRPRLHADELQDSGGAQLAADLGAASADHLGAISEAGIGALARAAEAGRPVVAVLLPATTLYLGTGHHAPARRLIEAGIPVALGTDFNPGTSPAPNLQLVLSLACLVLAMTPAEALVATTANAALALGLDGSRGTLAPGAQADVIVWDVPSLDLLPYWIGANLARAVVKRGEVVWRAAPIGSAALV